MPTLTVRNVSIETRQALKERAARNDRSMEAEVRAILEAAVGRPNHVRHWLAGAESIRGDELELPRRGPSRDVDLS